MNRPILIKGARQLLTLRGPQGPHRGADLRNLSIIQDGAVLVSNGVILEVGLTRRLENLALARQAQEINAAGCVVLPGFVDSHTHLIGGPARLLDYEMNLAGATGAEISQAGGGLAAISKAIQQTSPHTLQTQAARVVGECLRHGTTTIEAKSGYGFTESAELKILRTHAALNEQFGNIVPTFLAAPIIPEEHDRKAGEYLDWLCAYMLPLVKRRNLAKFADIVCEEGAFSLEATRRYLDAAKELDFALKIHSGEHSSVGGVRVAVEVGAVSVDHAVHVQAEEVDLLARSSIVATLLPGPVFYLGTNEYASARTLIDRGVAVALATNYNPETSPTYNMQMILALACNMMGMTPAEAISSATINGAHALGLGAQIGSIEVGKQADLVIFDVPDYRELPYHFGVNAVAMTIKKGVVIYQASGVQWPPN